MPYAGRKPRPNNALANSLQHQMALIPRRDPWGKRYHNPFSNEVRSRWRLYAQGYRGPGAGGGTARGGRYGNPYPRAYGAGNFGGVRTPWFGRPAYTGGYHGAYGGYGGYGRHPYAGLPRQGMWANPYRGLYPRYPPRPLYNHGRGYGRYAPQYQHNYRNYSPNWNRRGPYRQPSYCEEEDFTDDENDYDSDGENDYYSSQYSRGYRGYTTDWDDDDDDFFDEDEFDNLEEDYESDFDDGGYDTDAYTYGHQGYGYGGQGGYSGYDYNRRGYR